MDVERGTHATTTLRSVERTSRAGCAPGAVPALHSGHDLWEVLSQPVGLGTLGDALHEPTCLLAAARRNAAEAPDDIAYRWLNSECREASSLTWAQLWQRAGAVGEKLLSSKAGLRPGALAMLTFPIGLDFLPALLGCMRAGIVAVSTYPPDLRRPATEIPRFEAFARDCGARVAITSPSFKRALRAVSLGGYSTPQIDHWVACNPAHRREGEVLDWDVEPTEDDLAFVQYTSGSTAEPKGVVVTHGCLRHCMARLMVASRGSTSSVTWVPQYHDMGLIGQYLLAIICRGRLVAMSPITFVRRPDLWIKAVAKYKPQGMVAPAFAYELAARRLRETGQSYDLSFLVTADCGGEPITKGALEAMLELGIPAGARSACYGMAEAVLWGATTWNVGHDPDTGVARTGNLAFSRALGAEIVIADPKTLTTVSDGEVGRIYIASPCIVPGYYNKPELNAKRFGLAIKRRSAVTESSGAASDAAPEAVVGAGPAGRFYDTMDLGYIKDGELYISGRAADVIIIAGRNVFPQDVERLAEQSLPLESPSSAVLLVEARPGKLPTKAHLRELHCTLETEFHLSLRCLLVFHKRALPKTTSGKVRRKLCRSMYFDGSLPRPQALLGDVPKYTPHLRINTGGNGEVATTAGAGAGTGAGAGAGFGTGASDHVPDHGSDDGSAATTFTELLYEYGVRDMDLTLPEAGVDSLRLARLIGDAQRQLGLTIDPATAASVPARQLEAAAVASRDAQPLVPLPSSAIPSSAAWGSLAAARLSAASSKRATAADDDAASITNNDPSAAAGFDTSDRAGRAKCAAAWQLLGTTFVVLLVAACTAPAAYVHARLSETRVESVLCWDEVVLGAVPLVWMVCLTLATIACKWMIVGRYRPGVVPQWSPAYLRWWVVDRLMNVWEVFVGRHLLGTPYLNLFYKLLGCPECPASAHIDAFLREVDLVRLGHHSGIDGTVLCRVLSPRGMLLAPVRVCPLHVVPATTVVYPGEMYRSGSRRDASGVVTTDWLQRATAPLAVLGAFSTALCASSKLAGELEMDPGANRLVFMFLVAHVLVLLGAIVLSRLLALPFIVDRLYETAAASLAWALDGTPVPPLLFRAMGARLALAVQMNTLLGSIKPSTAALVSVGAGSVLSTSCIRPAPGPGGRVIIGRGVTVGLHAWLGPGVRLGDGSAVTTLTAVPPATVVDPGTVLLGIVDGEAGIDSGRAFGESASLGQASTRLFGRSPTPAGAVVGSAGTPRPGHSTPTTLRTPRTVASGATTPRSITYPASARRRRSSPASLGCCRVMAWQMVCIVLRAAMQWVPFAAGLALVIRLTSEAEDSTEWIGMPLGVQVPLLTLLAMVLSAAVVVLIYVATAWVVLPAPQRPLHMGGTANHKPKLAAQFPIVSTSTFAYAAYNSNDSVINTYVRPFIAGSWICNVVVAGTGVRFESVWDAVLQETFVMDGRLATIGAGAVLDRAPVHGHRMQHDSLLFKPVSVGSGSSMHPASLLLGGDRLGPGVVLAAHSAFFGESAVELGNSGEYGVVAGTPAAPAGPEA